MNIKLLQNLLKGIKSNSNQHTYNCNYMNKAFAGDILWTNPTPNVDFASQNITLSSSDYDMYEIIYKPSLGTTQEVNTGRVIKGTGTRLANPYTSDNGVGCRLRTIDYVNDTTLLVNDGKEARGTTAQATSNGVCIPLYVIGYKNGLFN